MGEIAIKKKAITKVLSCFFVLVILMTVLPIFVTQTNAVMPVDIYMGKVTGKNNDVLTVQIEYKLDYSNPHNWVSYSATSQWTISNSNAINEIRVGDYIEIAGLLGVDNEGESICIGKMKSSTEKIITDVHGDPDYLVPVHAFIEHPGVLNPPLLGNYIITYENIPDCSKYPSGSFACNVEAKYSDVTISKGNEQLKSQRLYPGRSFKYEDKGRGYNIDITFNSGEAPAYPDCTDQPCFGPQAFSDFTIHIKKIEEKMPDLIIPDITWSPSNPKEGDDVEFTIIVKNQGKGRADESWLGFRFFPPKGIPVGSEVRLRCPPLDSGETASLYDTINLSTCGKYTFKATADARKDIKESREDNNEKTAIINIECPAKKPDLIIQNIIWSPSKPKEGDKVTFTVTVKNQESESAGAFYVYYYIDDSYVDHDYVSLLSAGSTSAQTFTWTADKCGNVEVKAVADATNIVTESNEENNQRVETINIGCPPKEKPDLIISDFYWSPPYPPRGGRVDFFVIVKNIGALASKSCMLKLEFGDFSYSRQVASLRSGKEVTYQIPFNPAKDGEPKTTRGIVEAIVDVNNEIYEDDETNNRKEKLICDYIGEIIERVKNGEDLRGQMFLVHGICFGTAPELPPALPKKLLCGDLPGEGTYVKKNNQVPFLPVCPYKGASLEIGDDVLIGGVLQEDFSIYKYHLFPSLFRKYPLANDFISVKQVTETLPLGVFSTIGAIAKERIVQNNAIFLGVGAGGIGTQDTYTVWFKVPSDMENIPITGIVQVRGKIIRSAGGKIPYYIEPVQDGIKPLWGETWSREEILLHIDCPVHITITDQYGRAISDMVANNIPGATVSVVNEEKTFRLPANLKYSVEISAYDTGTFNFTRFSPIGNDISITKFENIPVTSSTKASVEIEPDVTDYTMSIDYNGDGLTDEEKPPDVNETIVNVGPENDSKDSYIKVVSGTIAGQDINPNTPEITVSPAKKISGSFDISVRNTGKSGSIFPIVATPNWGPHESSYWSITGHQAPGIKTHTVNVDLNAPSKPGVYYIIVAGQWELSAANVASGTNWVVGENHWNDGNDLADWSTSMIEQAIKSGLVIADWEKVKGMVKIDVPATAIRVNVVTEKPTPTGSISVTSEPSGATIHLEGSVDLSIKTPHTFSNVPVGIYTLELSLDGYEDWSTNVYVMTGETSYVHAILDWLAP